MPHTPKPQIRACVESASFLSKELILHCGKSGLLDPQTISSEAKFTVPRPAHIPQRVKISHSSLSGPCPQISNR